MEKLKKPEPNALLLFHGVNAKKQGNNVGEMRGKHSKMKAKNNAMPKEFKNWTQTGEDELTLQKKKGS